VPPRPKPVCPAFVNGNAPTRLPGPTKRSARPRTASFPRIRPGGVRAKLPRLTPLRNAICVYPAVEPKCVVRAPVKRFTDRIWIPFASDEATPDPGTLTPSGRNLAEFPGPVGSGNEIVPVNTK